MKFRAEQQNPNDLSLTLIKTLVPNGTLVSEGDELIEVEGQKAAFEITAPQNGYFYCLIESGSEFDIDRELYMITEEPIDLDKIDPPEKKLLRQHAQEKYPALISTPLNSETQNDTIAARLDFEGKAYQPRIAFFGGGRAFSQCVDLLNETNAFEVAGYFDDKERAANKYQWLGSINNGLDAEILQKFRVDCVFVSIGSGPKRFDTYSKLIDVDIRIATLIHPTAQVSQSAKIMVGSFIGPFVHIGPKAIIEAMNFVSAHCNIDHHCHIDQNCLLGPGVQLSGGVNVGASTVLSAGVSVESNIMIGSNAFVTSGKGVNTIVSDGQRIIK